MHGLPTNIRPNIYIPELVPRSSYLICVPYKVCSNSATDSVPVTFAYHLFVMVKHRLEPTLSGLGPSKRLMSVAPPRVL